MNSIPKLAALALSLIAAAAVPSPLIAAQITGGISFAGDYNPVDINGNVVSDLTLADKMLFGPSGSIGPTTVSVPVRAVPVFAATGVPSGLCVPCPSDPRPVRQSRIHRSPVRSPSGVTHTSERSCLTGMAAELYAVRGSASAGPIGGPWTLVRVPHAPGLKTWLRAYRSSESCFASLRWRRTCRRNCHLTHGR